MRKSFQILSTLTCLFASTAFAAEPVSSVFVDVNGQNIGTAKLSDIQGGMLLSIDVNLPEGVHAIHIHANGSCDAPDFKTAGGHFNPGNRKHGLESAEGSHAGDLPNLYVEKTGHIKAEMFSPAVHLSGKDVIEHGAIVIHEKADDYSSDPAGNAGNRIACAVI